MRELPVEFDQPVALQFRFHETEAGHDVEIEVEVLGPSLTLVGEPTSFTITPQLAPYRPEGWEGMYAVTGTVVLYAEELGAHTVSIKIDGKVEGSIPFQIIQAPDQE